MLWHTFWVLVSFFAVIGLLECVVGVVELLSLWRVRAVQKIVLQVSLAGEEPNVEYLLNTLCLKSGRLDVGDREAVLEIIDAGLAEQTRKDVLQYCEKNPWVVFTADENNDIM